MTSTTPTPEEAMTDTYRNGAAMADPDRHHHDGDERVTHTHAGGKYDHAHDPERVDPQEQYLQEQEAAAAAPVGPAPDTRRQRPRSTLPVISEAEALDRIAALIHADGENLCPLGVRVLEVITQTARQPAEVAARLAKPSRLDRLRAFADSHRLPQTEADAVAGDYQGSALPRFALLEHFGGESFLTLHDTPDDAAGYHATQEDAGWVIEKLVDLDTGAELTAETKTSVTWTSP